VLNAPYAISQWRNIGEKSMQRLSEATSSDDDHVLLQRAAAGDAETLGVLYDRYGKLVFSVALRITGDHGSAEEITQDAFLRLWDNAHRYQSERGSLVGWLLTITQRRAIDELRSRRGSSRRREVSIPEALPLDERIDHATLTQLRADLQQALAELPSAQREVIEATFFGGLSCREIAQQSSAPQATVYTRMRLGMEKLRTILLGGESQLEAER
jgi:RNA polymerase sigma-70 factor (ECF subfamily)